MPLVWAHAEYLKLVRSLADGRVFDLPPQTAGRYLGKMIPVPYFIWRFNHKIRRVPSGRVLRIETLAPARVRWSDDDWQTVRDEASRDTGLSLWSVDLPTEALAEGRTVRFTFFWPDADRWEGVDFEVEVGPYELMC